MASIFRSSSPPSHRHLPPLSPFLSTNSFHNGGDISPSFNASFASSMSISSDDVLAPSPPNRLPFLHDPPTTTTNLSASTSSTSSDVMMDVCPPSILQHRHLPPILLVPDQPQPHQHPPPPARPSKLQRSKDSYSHATEYPFLQSLLERNKKSKLSAADGGSPSSSGFMNALREKTNDRSENRGTEVTFEKKPSTTTRPRAGLPTSWSNQSRPTAPVGSLLQPPIHPIPLERLSEPTLPTAPLFSANTNHAKLISPPIRSSSSPFQMDVDDSPQSNSLHPPHQPIMFRSISDPPSSASSTASTSYSSSVEREQRKSDDRLEDLFHDLSPIISRKRFLDQVERSPTPSSNSSSSSSLPTSSNPNFLRNDSSSSTTTLLNKKLSSASISGGIGGGGGQQPLQQRKFEKASSTNNLQAARRRRSSTTLNNAYSHTILSGSISHHLTSASTSSSSSSASFFASINSSSSSSTTCSATSLNRRPGLSALIPSSSTSSSTISSSSSSSTTTISSSTSCAASTTSTENVKRHATINAEGKPSNKNKSIRRAYSVADAVILPSPFFLSSHTGNSSSGILPALKKGNELGEGGGGTTFFQTLGRRAGSGVSQSIDIGMMMDIGSPSPIKNTLGGGGLFGGEEEEVVVGKNVRRPKLEIRRGSESPLTGFRTQEEKGKVLPCFGVKEDGLMRIDADTLNLLQLGVFSDKVKSYTVIDCRFSYEFQGGHISEAVNLPTTLDIELNLLSGDQNKLPTPSTSEALSSEGKNILIFHCEFSAKRAPTSAKHLRSKDRLINGHDYPNIHYPEVYILQGGYAEYYKKYPNRCTGGYLSMDDPDHNTKRSVNLHAFRQQTRQFARASSFTFGEAQSASAILKAQSRPPIQRPSSAFVFPSTKTRTTTSSSANSTTSSSTTSSISNSSILGSRPTLPTFLVDHQDGEKKTKGMSITEEEHEADSSFEKSSAGGSSPLRDSPCPGSKIGRHSLKLGKESKNRRGMMERAQTSSVLMFRR